MSLHSAPPSGERTRVLEGDGFAVEVLESDLNLRLQVLGYRGADLVPMVGRLAEVARERSYSKVFMKARAADGSRLEAAGMETEATIAGYWNGEDAAVMSLFLDEARRRRPFEEEERDIMVRITSRPPDPSLPDLPADYTMKPATEEDLEELAALYREVFPSYPYPITDPDYLRRTMDHILYRVVRDGDDAMVAAASAETDLDHRNAEMTDFATLPSQRGLGLAQIILASLEGDMDERAIPNLYTVARARSAGMNRVFYNRGYHYTGTLVNNCHISGQFEDMHVWCKGV